MDVLLDTRGRRRVNSLLLLYLFVVKAAADCRKPEGLVNIVLTNKALLMNDFPAGSDVTLECAKGYVYESGSEIITCVGDKWTEPELTCKKKDCGQPKPQPHMSFNISAGTLFGAVIRVRCDKGFQLSGSSYKQCYPIGWIGKSKCEMVTCDKPAQVANGRSSWDSQDYPQYGEIVRYVCNKGYALVGRDSVVCSETGAYDSQPPACKGLTTEDGITTKMITPTSTPPAQEATTSTESPASPTAHRDKTVTTTSATPAVSPSARGGDILTAAGRATTTGVTSVTSSPFQGNKAIETNKDIGYIAVVVSVICVTLAACIVALFLHKFLLRRKGSANGTVPIY